MEKNRQDIVPLTLQEQQRKHRSIAKHAPQKLVARSKMRDSELIICQKINEATLKTLLTGVP